MSNGSLSNIRNALIILFCCMSLACCDVSRAQIIAFAVTDDGIYATCAHLVKNISDYSIKVIALDEDNDLALLKIFEMVPEDKPGKFAIKQITRKEYLQIASSPTTIGEKLFLTVLPPDDPIQIELGSCAGATTFGPQKMLAIEGMRPSDGSPVVNSKGKVVGITRHIEGRGPMFIPSEHLLALIETAGIKPGTPKPVEPSAVQDHIKNCLQLLYFKTQSVVVDYGRDQIHIMDNCKDSAKQIADFINDHGRKATVIGENISIPFIDKTFGSLYLISGEIMPSFGEVPPSLVARVVYKIKKKFQQEPAALEVIKWANEMECHFPSLSIHTNAMNNELYIEQALSFSKIITWHDLSASIQSFQIVVEMLAQGEGNTGFRKYIVGFENLPPWSP